MSAAVTEMIIMIVVTIVLVTACKNFVMHFMAMILINIHCGPGIFRQPFETDEDVANEYRDQD